MSKKDEFKPCETENQPDYCDACEEVDIVNDDGLCKNCFEQEEDEPSCDYCECHCMGEPGCPRCSGKCTCGVENDA